MGAVPVPDRGLSGRKQGPAEEGHRMVPKPIDISALLRPGTGALRSVPAAPRCE